MRANKECLLDWSAQLSAISEEMIRRAQADDDDEVRDWASMFDGIAREMIILAEVPRSQQPRSPCPRSTYYDKGGDILALIKNLKRDIELGFVPIALHRQDRVFLITNEADLRKALGVAA